MNHSSRRRLLGVRWGELPVVEHPPSPPAAADEAGEEEPPPPRVWKRTPWEPAKKAVAGVKHVGDHRLERHFPKGKNHGGGLAARTARYQVMQSHPKGRQLHHDATHKHSKHKKGKSG